MPGRAVGTEVAQARETATAQLMRYGEGLLMERTIGHPVCTVLSCSGVAWSWR